MNINPSIKNEIINYWNNHRLCSNVNKYIEKGSETDIFLESYLKQYPWFETKKKLISFIAKGIYTPLKCKKCGKFLRIDNASEGKKYCSISCATNSSEVKQKRKKTCIKNNGVEFPSQSKKVMEKFKTTMINKYGAEYTLQSKQLKNKYSKTMIEKYGISVPFCSEEIKQKFKNTMMNKHGVIHPSQIKQVRQSNSKRNRKNGYQIILNKWKDYVIPLFSEDEYEGLQKEHYGKLYKWKCVKCGNEFEQKAVSTGFHKKQTGSYFIPVCPICYSINNCESIIEKELLYFIKFIYAGQIMENNKKIINPYELDIYLPEKNLAIEFDGLYWHSQKKGKSKNYHLKKTLLCEKQGIQLIHIFQDEWKYKQEIVKDIIKSKLGIYDKKVYARKCEIKQIDEKTASDFLQKNHLQGYVDSDVRYGLFYENELVFVMTFSKNCFDSSYEYVLTRFASKLTYYVVGGVSRLLTTFKRNFKVSLTTCVDKRYSNGELYEKLGFELVSQSKPQCWFTKSHKRYSFDLDQNNEVSILLGSKFKEKLSVQENLIMNGFYKIYDCGNFIFKMPLE